jgi:hypothetical protein
MESRKSPAQAGRTHRRTGQADARSLGDKEEECVETDAGRPLPQNDAEKRGHQRRLLNRGNHLQWKESGAEEKSKGGRQFFWA